MMRIEGSIVKSPCIWWMPELSQMKRSLKRLRRRIQGSSGYREIAHS